MGCVRRHAWNMLARNEALVGSIDPPPRKRTSRKVRPRPWRILPWSGSRTWVVTGNRTKRTRTRTRNEAEGWSGARPPMGRTRQTQRSETVLASQVPPWKGNLPGPTKRINVSCVVCSNLLLVFTIKVMAEDSMIFCNQCFFASC